MYDWNLAKTQGASLAWVTPNQSFWQRTNGGLRFLYRRELDNTGTFRARAVVKNFSLFNISSGFKQLNEVIVEGGPRKLFTWC